MLTLQGSVFVHLFLWKGILKCVLLITDWYLSHSYRYMYIWQGYQRFYVIKFKLCNSIPFKNAGIPIDNIFVAVDGQVYQQSVGMPVGTNCALSYRTSFIFIWGGIHSKTSTWEEKQSHHMSFNSTFRYTLYRYFIY
jgi:hypothetical protein